MPLRKIITPANPILRKKTQKITRFKDTALQTLIDDMIETMLAAPGVGLAAPQVAVSKKLIIVRLPDDEESVAEHGEDAGVLHVVLNPEIVRVSREIIDGVEGCLSIPGYLGLVDRHTGVTIKGNDRHGKPIRIKARNWLARVFQHEIDHLDGVLFIDKSDQIWKIGEKPPELDEENDDNQATDNEEKSSEPVSETSEVAE